MLNWVDFPLRKNVEKLYENSELPVTAVDKDLLVVWANAGALSCFGGMNRPDGVLNLLPNEAATRAKEAVSRGLAVSMTSGYLPLATIAMFFSPLESEEKDRVSLVHFEVNRELGTMGDPMGANRVVTAFSRQMRTPLSMIFAQLSTLSSLREICGSEEMRGPLRSIGKSSYLLLRHCVNVTEFTRFQSGINPAVFTAVDMCETVSEICRAAAMLSEDIGIPLTVSVPGTPMFCRTDTEKLQYALLNIISNSCKFTRENNEIFISLEKYSGGARITITDKGLGIEPEKLPLIFDPFYSAAQPGDAGGGLGLTVAKMCIGALGGGITVRSTVERGTTIVLSLPLESPCGEDLQLSATRVIDYMTDRFSPMYVILSDACKTPEG